MAEILPPGARVAVLEPWGYGLMNFAIKYQLWRPGREDRDLRVLKRIDYIFWPTELKLPWTAGTFSDPGITHLVINDPPPEYAELLGIPSEKAKAFLLEKGDGGWRIMRSWVRQPGPDGRTE